jgi:hypothetical protein
METLKRWLAGALHWANSQTDPYFYLTGVDNFDLDDSGATSPEERVTFGVLNHHDDGVIDEMDYGPTRAALSERLGDPQRHTVAARALLGACQRQLAGFKALPTESIVKRGVAMMRTEWACNRAVGVTQPAPGETNVQWARERRQINDAARAALADLGTSRKGE